MTSPCNSPTWLRNAAPIEPMTLDQCRRFYADEIQYAANLHSPALIEAFARVPRENFLGPGPWQIGVPDVATGKVEYLTTPSADARHVYHNVTIALDPARNLCNGQPSSLAAWMSALDLQPGNRVFHLGCGVGYFTAIMAEVVGLTGSVIASEVDSAFAARARQNLVEYSNVEVHGADGAALDPGMCDAIFINAGVTHPHPPWLERLREGGRMILPLTIPMGLQIGKGVMTKIVRQTTGLSAQGVSFVAIYSCTSARDPQLEPLLTKAMTTGALFKMKSVRQDAHDAGDTCIVHGLSVCISGPKRWHSRNRVVN